MTATLTLIGFTLLLRALAEVWGANLGNQFGTSPDTHFGVDFGIPSRPGTEPFRILTDLFSLLSGFTIVIVSLNGQGHPLFAVATGLITIFFLGAGFVAGNEKRALAAYAVGSCAAYATALCLLHNNFRLEDQRLVAGLALTAVGGHFASSLIEKNVSDALGKALFGVTGGLFAVLVFLALTDFTEFPGHRIETLLVFGSATLCFAHAAFARTREFGYPAALCGGFAFARLFQLGHLPNREFPTAFATYGFLLLLTGMFILPRREEEVLENERLSPVFRHCGHFFTVGGLIGVVLAGLDLPVETMERVRLLGSMALGIIIGATVAAVGRDRATRMIYACIGLAFVDLTGLQILRVANVAERNFPAMFLLLGFAQLVFGIQILPKLQPRTADPEAPDFAGLFKVGGHLLTVLSLLAVGMLGLSLSTAMPERITLLGSLALAIGTTATIGTVARERAVREIYSLAAIGFTALFYVRVLNAFGISTLENIELFTIPLGALLMGVGLFKLRGRDAGTGLGETFIWIGAFLFCVPVMLHAFQVRFERGGSARIDILTDTAALVALAGGWWLRQRGPVVFGSSVLMLHLSVVILDSVKWGQVPYAVYLFGIGSAFFGLGAVVWQLSRHPEWLERIGAGLRDGWRARFTTPPRG